MLEKGVQVSYMGCKPYGLFFCIHWCLAGKSMRVTNNIIIIKKSLGQHKGGGFGPEGKASFLTDNHICLLVCIWNTLSCYVIVEEKKLWPCPLTIPVLLSADNVSAHRKLHKVTN